MRDSEVAARDSDVAEIHDVPVIRILRVILTLISKSRILFWNQKWRYVYMFVNIFIWYVHIWTNQFQVIMYIVWINTNMIIIKLHINHYFYYLSVHFIYNNCISDIIVIYQNYLILLYCQVIFRLIWWYLLWY